MKRLEVINDFHVLHKTKLNFKNDAFFIERKVHTLVDKSAQVVIILFKVVSNKNKKKKKCKRISPRALRRTPESVRFFESNFSKKRIILS